MTPIEILNQVEALAEQLETQAQDIYSLEKKAARTKVAKKLKELEDEITPRITLKDSLSKQLDALAWQYLQKVHQVGDGSLVSIQHADKAGVELQAPFIITGVRLRKLYDGSPSLYVMGIDAEKNVVHCVKEPKPVMVEICAHHRIVDESF